MYDLSTFRLERILNNNTKSKTISLLGTFPSQQQQQPEQQSQESIAGGGDRAIVVLEKTAFTDDDVNTHDVDNVNADQNNGAAIIDGGLQRRYFSLDTQLKQEFINDIYGNFLCYPQPDINSNNFHISFTFLEEISTFLWLKVVVVVAGF